ncbi:hypothetical protein AAHC03_013988 [Spirometra sp. Aus1]
MNATTAATLKAKRKFCRRAPCRVFKLFRRQESEWQNKKTERSAVAVIHPIEVQSASQMEIVKYAYDADLVLKQFFSQTIGGSLRPRGGYYQLQCARKKQQTPFPRVPSALVVL